MIKYSISIFLFTNLINIIKVNKKLKLLSCGFLNIYKFKMLEIIFIAFSLQWTLPTLFSLDYFF
ncbi:MAG: hypothetical protein ACI9WV_002022 [Patiriisocius sp.]|jgi:hypothetical protein